MDRPPAGFRGQSSRDIVTIGLCQIADTRGEGKHSPCGWLPAPDVPARHQQDGPRRLTGRGQASGSRHWLGETGSPQRRLAVLPSHRSGAIHDDAASVRPTLRIAGASASDSRGVFHCGRKRASKSRPSAIAPTTLRFPALDLCGISCGWGRRAIEHADKLGSIKLRRNSVRKNPG